MEQKLPYIHNMIGWNYRMTEMQSAIGLAELARMDDWNMPTRKRNGAIVRDALKGLPQVKYVPVDTEERRNGWYTMAYSLDIENMTCDIMQFVQACCEEGAPVWKVFWPQCHTERAFREHTSFGASGFPFKSSEYTDPKSSDYSNVDVPNALWHETHTFTCFPFPSYSEDDMHQVANAVVKVIEAYSK
jgi:dTDP-4-amino-4,6-dideoxygalactose transaminase